MPVLVGALSPLGSVSALLGTALAVVANRGMSYYQKKRIQKNGSRGGGSNVQQNIRQAAMPRYYIAGRARVGGLLAQFESKGEYMYVAPILSDDLITKIETFYVRNIEVLTSKSGDIYTVTTPPFNTTQGSFIRFEVKYGYVDQTVSTLLSQAFPAAYGVNDNGAGIAYVVCEIKQTAPEDFQRIMGGTIPEFAFLVSGAECPDPRVNRNLFALPDWAPTTNPALHNLRYFVAGNGMALSQQIFNLDSYIRVANHCDELVQTKNKGMRKRYEMGGIISYETAPKDVIEAINNTFAGDHYLDDQGLIALTCDDLEVASITLTEAHVIEVNYDPGVGSLYETTSVKTRFSSEDHGYQEAVEEAQQWDDAAAVEAVGRSIPLEFDLPYVFRHDQARRLMEKEYHKQNPRAKFEFVFKFHGIKLIGERIFRFTYAPLGLDETLRIESLQVERNLSEVRCSAVTRQPPRVWNPQTDEGTAPVVPPIISEDATPLTPANLKVVTGNTTAVLRWDELATEKTAEAQYKLTSDSDWTSISPNPTVNYLTLSDLTAATNYDFRVRATDPLIGVSNWATITFITNLVTGSATEIASLAADGGINRITGKVKQSSSLGAITIQMSLSSSVWTSAISLSAFKDDEVNYEMTGVTAGAQNVYARSINIDGTIGPVFGPAPATVTQQVSSTGGSGSSNSGGGGGGTTPNDPNGGVYRANFEKNLLY